MFDCIETFKKGIWFYNSEDCQDLVHFWGIREAGRRRPSARTSPVTTQIWFQNGILLYSRQSYFYWTHYKLWCIDITKNLLKKLDRQHCFLRAVLESQIRWRPVLNVVPTFGHTKPQREYYILRFCSGQILFPFKPWILKLLQSYW